jgi:hypothetical protein
VANVQQTDAFACLQSGGGGAYRFEYWPGTKKPYRAYRRDDDTELSAQTPEELGKRPDACMFKPVGPGAASQPWPVHSQLSFAALPSAVPCARLHVRWVCLEWGLGSIADTAELLASELMTNAVQESERLRTRADLAIVPVVDLWLVCDRMSVVIHVWDASDDMPVPEDVTADDEGGRGLMLVQALGKEWGAYRTAEGGKVVWVRCATTPAVSSSSVEG